VLLGLAAERAAAIEPITGLARVAADGTLVVGDRRVRLFGIFIPLDGRQCRTWLRPPLCAAPAVLALSNRITGFVRCEPRRLRDDGVIEAVCFARAQRLGAGDDDLAAQLLLEGWALAGPDAPFEYRGLERIAERRGVGLWNPGVTIFR
jgi:endonuclease YncB( thermonuclease family)